VSDYGLSTQQLAVICALSSGATSAAAAEQAGVHRNTILNWRRNCLPFQYGLANAQYDRALCFRERMEAEFDLAIQCLHQILTDPKAPPSVRLKAALAVINVASTPPAPKKEVHLDIEKIVSTSHPEPVTPDQLEPAAVHNDAQPDAVPEKPSPVHNHAQPAPPQPIRRESARLESKKPGRNEPCPCGSGKKIQALLSGQSGAFGLSGLRGMIDVKGRRP
jgi:hypothetical protein